MTVPGIASRVWIVRCFWIEPQDLCSRAHVVLVKSRNNSSLDDCRPSCDTSSNQKRNKELKTRSISTWLLIQNMTPFCWYAVSQVSDTVLHSTVHFRKTSNPFVWKTNKSRRACVCIIRASRAPVVASARAKSLKQRADLIANNNPSPLHHDSSESSSAMMTCQLC